MDLDKYQAAWKADTEQVQVKFDREALSKEVLQSHEGFQSIIFWRDVREVGTALFLIPIWLIMGYAISLPWTWYLSLIALVWVAGFLLIDRKLFPQRPSEPGKPLLFYVKESLTQVEHQIWLLRNVFWWYLLPFTIAIVAFFFHCAWSATGHWLGTAMFGGGLSLFPFFTYRKIYQANQQAVRDQLEPRRQNLLKLVSSLEGQVDDEDAGDIMELVAGLDDLSSLGIAEEGDRFENHSWTGGWEQIIPSWRVAAWIIVPTLIGALCGLYSGMFLQIEEMGPTIFQAVVGAVIPFEVALGWICWRFYKNQDAPFAEVFANLAKGKGDGANEFQSLPKAPAITIFVLTLFIGIMAFVAIAAFAFHANGSANSGGYSRFLDEPEFGEISAFEESDVKLIDGWLEEQVEKVNYPSLTVAILQDSKTVYKHSVGFENVSSGKQSTMQTQYHVASVTKVFTASLAVMLEEQGIVDLDQPVLKYLPDGVSISRTPDLGAMITLRQLASHTSGLPRGVAESVQSTGGWYDLEPNRLYDLLAKVELESEPGTEELYSNLGFGLLGHALEKASGKPIDQLLQEMICQPLGLERTAFQDDGQLQPATGYEEGNQIERTHSFQRRLMASGGLVTSAEDLAEFLAQQMEPGVFSEQALKLLHKRSWTSTGKVTGTALGWSLGWNSFVGRIVYKNGGRANCSAWIGFSEEYKTGVVVVTNSGGPEVERIGRWLLERSVSGAFTPVSKYGFAYVAPFTAVRWENNRPIVRVNDEWSPIVSIDDISIEKILEFATQEYGGKARKRFAEDIVRVLSELGHDPDWSVSLGLEREDGKVEKVEALLTSKKRSAVRSYALENK